MLLLDWPLGVLRDRMQNPGVQNCETGTVLATQWSQQQRQTGWLLWEQLRSLLSCWVFTFYSETALPHPRLLLLLLPVHQSGLMCAPRCA